MSRPYLQHGRRHGIFGSDPLPDSPYIAGHHGGITLASGSTGIEVDLNPATISWGTDEGAGTPSSYFDLRDPGSGTYEIALLSNGLYELDAYAFFETGSAPAASSSSQMGISNTITQIGGDLISPWQATPIGTPAYATDVSCRALLNWPDTYASPPIYHGIFLYQNTGATITNIEVGFSVRLLNFGNTGF